MKTHLSALASAISSISLLTACGGGSGGPDTFEPTPLKPRVTISAPATAIVGVAFDISWTSTSVTSCVANFDSSTATANTVSKTEATTGTHTYTVTCTGVAGTVTDTTNVLLNPAAALTAEGLWQGSTGNTRAITGVVTKEGDYWLVYAPSINASTVGFITGSLNTTSTSQTQGTLTSNNLREVNFAGAGTKAGAILSATYTAKNSVSGSLDPVVGTSGSGSYTLGASGTTTALNGAITLSNLAWTGTGNANINGGVFSDASFAYTQNITSPLDASVNANITGTMALSPTGAIVDTYTGCTGSSSVCSSIAPLINVPQSYSANPFNLGNLASLTWTATTYSSAPGFGTTTTVANYTATQTSFTPSGIAAITADTFNLTTYNAAYETVPSLTNIAGNYTAQTTGIGSTNNPGATFTVNANGALTLGIDSGSHCAFTATIAAHATGGNVYDVTAITFSNSGGACAYAGETFAGVAIYDGTTKLTITALNQDRDKGFMIIATK